MVAELDLIQASTGDRPDACPWHVFRDPDVGEVLRAYDWFESGQIREWWGNDPPYWLVLGVRHYHRVLQRVLTESYRLEREERAKAKGRRAALPQGHEMEFEIRG